ncbi:uncharacterized protein LOC120659824 [Panicum virgatum]|uniref:KIB1-4 beta-propeller domain-containing protein n=1 Tax=Panicum virgatum TaxID=38727 RepID=A0A8T0VER1_PANVG|nr:uncharacterized protein LOC120659824 [Panicum virgatum]KAG2632935.1 hypothetical protein PVAP13_2NG132303 [Panicum virgatum]
MQSPSKISGASASSTTTPAVRGLQGWADLPEDLIQSIIPLLGSILELLAFAGTCRSWRAAFSSHPSKSTFCTLLPPLLVLPHISVRVRHVHKLCVCLALDPTNSKSTLHCLARKRKKKSTLRCKVPEEVFFGKMFFVGSSYGQLICGGGKNCLVVDVFTGAKVLPPQLPFVRNTYFYSGMLTAPLASHNSHLLVCAASSEHSTQSSLLDWPVGSDSWSELQLDNSWIEQIVEFNGQFIAMDSRYRLYTLSLAPHLGLQEIATVRWDGTGECPYLSPSIVLCGDMLLMVDHKITLRSGGAPVKYKAHRLDMSTVPASWVEVKLENHALFLGKDARSPVFSCVSPGRWAGQSNCLYYCGMYQPWILNGLGDEADTVWDPTNDLDTVGKRNRYLVARQPFWAYPSMFYSN